MIGALKPYPVYRDSRIEWLEKVPKNWKVRRLKTRVRNVVDPISSPISERLCLALENVESWTGEIRLPDNGVRLESQLKKFVSGDILFGKLRPYLAKVTRPDHDGACVGEFLVLRPRRSDVVGPYIELLLRSQGVIEEVSSSTFGAKMPRADWTFLGGMSIPLPPTVEQLAIVRFLDSTDRHISRYIRAKEKLLALLGEQKRAVVHEAVTGRVDVRTGQPYPAYRKSDVEWLGEVPEHWDVRRLKHWLAMNRKVLPEKTDPDYAFHYIDIGSVSNGRLTEAPERLRFGNAPSRARRIVHHGDTIVSTVRTYLKAVWHAAEHPGDLIASTGFAVLTPDRDSSPKFVSYTCQSHPFTDRVTAESIGIAYPAIGEKRLATLSVCVPPLPEQAAIVRYLDNASAIIDRTIELSHRQIALAHEYRTRLVSDVVTGKLDVREAVAALPRSGSGRNREPVR